MPFSLRENGAYLRDSLYTFAENCLVVRCNVSEGQIDAIAACQSIVSRPNGSDSMEDEPRRTTPYQHISMLHPDTARGVRTPQRSQKKSGR